MNELKNRKSITKVYIFPSVLSTGILLLLFACNTYRKEPFISNDIKDSIVHLNVTLIAGLADKNKPVVTLLDTVPKPEKTVAHSVALSTHFFIDPLTGLPLAPDAQGKALFTTYSTDDGLALDQVYCSFKDSHGTIWFGTNGGGISRFDGTNFINYTTIQGLANNVVWCITEDRKGNIWIGTDASGVSMFDGKVFTNYSTADGLANDIVYSITPDHAGNLWFGTNRGVSKFDGKSFTALKAADALNNSIVRKIIEDKNGNLWFGTLGGVSKFDGKRITHYTVAQGLPNDSIKSILEDNKGNLWFGSDGGGVSKFDGRRFTNYNISRGIGDNSVLSIEQDKNGNIWFGTNNSGVTCNDGKQFVTYTTSQGLAANTVRSVTEDDKGNLWFGSFGGGVSKYEGRAFMNFTRAHGLPGNVVYSITEDSAANLWLGIFGGGLCKYDRKSFTIYSTKQGLVTNSIYCTARDNKGNIWVGTYGEGVIKFDGKSFTTYTTEQGLANNVVFCITQDKTGNLWFGCSGGASKFDGKRFTTYTKAQGLTDNQVFGITEDSHSNLWFITSGGGASLYDGNSFITLSSAQGLISNTVWAITEDKHGNLWFGTQEGLSLLSSETLKKVSAGFKSDTVVPAPLFKSFTTKDGLPDNFVTQVVVGNQEQLYVGTNKGVCELLPTMKGNNARVADWHFGNVFNSSTGYPIKDVNAGPGAMFKDSHGILWIGTGSDKTGLVRFDPAALNKKENKPPPLIIHSVQIDEEKIAWNDLGKPGNQANANNNKTAANIVEEVNAFGRPLSTDERTGLQNKFGDVSFDSIASWYPVPVNLVVPYKHNNITIDFNAIETGRNSLIKYKYILDGYDKNWSPASYKTSATFGNIYEGKYTFRVKAQNPGGIWSNPATYTFRVLAPWWRTWWMYLFYSVVLITAVVMLSKWNNKRIIKQKNRLELEVAAATTIIRNEKEKAEQQKKKAEETLKELESAQALLIQSEKMASLGELTAGIAHEIQNPLNFVNNFSDIGRELVDEMNAELEKGDIAEVKFIAADIKQNLEKINHHGKRADSIVKGMLEHSRSGSGVKEPTDINKLADEFTRLAYHGMRAKDKSFNVKLVTEFDDSIGQIAIVGQDIGRVILNLVNNAFYAVQEKSKQGLEVYEPTVIVRTKKEDRRVCVQVSDNGNGIPDKIKEKIFQPFFTTKPTGQGTGLGLSLCYDIVKAHGGEIKAHSSEGEGTRFVVEIPV